MAAREPRQTSPLHSPLSDTPVSHVGSQTEFPRGEQNHDHGSQPQDSSISRSERGPQQQEAISVPSPFRSEWDYASSHRFVPFVHIVTHYGAEPEGHWSEPTTFADGVPTWERAETPPADPSLAALGPLDPRARPRQKRGSLAVRGAKKTVKNSVQKQGPDSRGSRPAKPRGGGARVAKKEARVQKSIESETRSTPYRQAEATGGTESNDNTNEEDGEEDGEDCDLIGQVTSSQA